jgi:hypothetical protein
MNSEEWGSMTPGAKREFDRAMRNVHETFWKEVKKVGKVSVFGTGGERFADGELEKMFKNPESYKVKPADNVFNEDVLRKRWDELEEIESVKPYDMTDEDYYQYLIDLEHLHCGPHSKDSPEGKWLEVYQQKKFRKTVVEGEEIFRTKKGEF